MTNKQFCADTRVNMLSSVTRDVQEASLESTIKTIKSELPGRAFCEPDPMGTRVIGDNGKRFLVMSEKFSPSFLESMLKSPDI